MSYRLLELPGMVVTALSFHETQCVLAFCDASIIKVMDAAQQRSRWRQSGRIAISGDFGDELKRPTVDLPRTAQSGEFHDNVLVYRDTIRLPCRAYGDVRLRLKLQRLAEALTIRGAALEVILAGTPQYINHID